jgi:hypothetical protein
MTPDNTKMRRRSAWCLAMIAALVVAFAAAGCGGGSSDDQASTTSSPAGHGEATITALNVPTSVPCRGKPSTTVAVSYATANATKVEMFVDGRPVDGVHSTSGNASPAVHCDGVPHDVVLRAVDKDGQPTILRKIVNTDTAT